MSIPKTIQATEIYTIGEQFTAWDISKVTGIHRDRITNALGNMCDAGLVIRNARGVYTPLQDRHWIHKTCPLGIRCE